MKFSAALIAGFTLTAVAAFGGDGTIKRSAHHVPGQYVAVLTSDANVASVAATVRGFSSAQIRHTYQKGVKGFALEMSDAEAQQLARDPHVQYIEEDSIVSASITWGLDRIDQRMLPLDNAYTVGYSGIGVTVYIVDTGILAAHSDFGGRVATGYTAFDDGNGTNDCDGHGTHVAGIIGGSEYGVAKSATLVPVRVLDCTGSGSVSTVLAGLDWVLANHQAGQPAVVNLSLNGPPSSALDNEVSTLLSAGVTTVVAAGNSNDNACNYSPARVPGAITVGASNSSDQRASFSNWGSCVDVFAPGLSITSDWYTSTTATAVQSGTSMAAPFVSGVAALTLEKYPAALPAAVSQTITFNATSDILTGLDATTANRLVYAQIDALSDGTSSDGQLLSDPGFDYGTTFWTSSICDITNPTGCPPGDGDAFMAVSFNSHSGKTHASLGGHATGAVVTSEAVAIPTTVKSSQLSFYLWVVANSKKPSISATLKVKILDPNGALLETLGTFSNLDNSPTYIQHRYDMTKYRGVPIRISFESAEDAGVVTWFLLDDVNLRIWNK